jgi:hypothetical protein
MTIQYYEMLAKSGYYSKIHNYKYNRYKRINNIITFIIFLLGIISFLLIFNFKKYNFIQNIIFIPNLIIVYCMLTSIWISYYEDIHKLSTNSWDKIALTIRDLIKYNNDNNEDLGLILYDNYNQNKKYSKMNITNKDINYFKHNLVKSEITSLYIDDFLKEISN